MNNKKISLFLGLRPNWWIDSLLQKNENHVKNVLHKYYWLEFVILCKKRLFLLLFYPFIKGVISEEVKRFPPSKRCFIQTSKKGKISFFIRLIRELFVHHGDLTCKCLSEFLVGYVCIHLEKKTGGWLTPSQWFTGFGYRVIPSICLLIPLYWKKENTKSNVYSLVICLSW